MSRERRDLVALGGAIRKRRNEIGLSQEELAARAGLDRSYIGGVERGERNVAFMNILKIARGLRVPAAELVREAQGAREA